MINLICFRLPLARGEDQIAINGLIWMGEEGFMMKQIQHKLSQGFSTLKMKIGAIDFETELKHFGFYQTTFRARASGITG